MSCIAKLGRLLFLQDIQSDIFLGCKSGILSEKCLARQVSFFLRQPLQKPLPVTVMIYGVGKSLFIPIWKAVLLKWKTYWFYFQTYSSTHGKNQDLEFLQLEGGSSKIKQKVSTRRMVHSIFLEVSFKWIGKIYFWCLVSQSKFRSRLLQKLIYFRSGHGSHVYKINQIFA